MEKVTENIETVSVWIDFATDFAVEYGFQILGAIVFFLVGLLVANWIGNRLVGLATAKNIDVTLSQFLGSVAKAVLIVLLIIITLGNFGVSIAPLIALAGAVTFGATLALQGPISNFGAGIAIILTRPFVIGNVITVQGVSGVVDRITLGITFLTGEDGEQIAVPNKEIVGQVIVNSMEVRIVESNFCIATDVEPNRVIKLVQDALVKFIDDKDAPQPQVGIQDFTYGGLVIGTRVWVPGLQYFEDRYVINAAIYNALQENGIELMKFESASLSLPRLNEGTGPATPPPIL
ncbi:mechanosensitive ion channel family protein [Sneathiella sp. HT1-7]|jgi:small conductance mechanosensitive channel|uniref:mechanosensitive ion channel family protein n=1 Tax=Sneathiella sp. HT1-7 TaxID=2887192 RepID=UPI001D150222|nr:mechanosensitive ion channel family protein [Sneathiella sp. HT1-7]MCC3306484.1 mechanosensitive ion channel family protein [Sneathiella sp. HT1-7]